jgi:hypothetical protein
MATVYLARDRKHGRQVAVKVLRPDLAASIGTDRFLKEIEIAASLTHPHVVPLHDSGEANGYLYYTMPFVEGGSLRSRLGSNPRLETAQALAITLRVADALSYAHRMGVLHRDIKPENILFVQGHAVVSDFGIAKAVSTAGGAELTRTGLALGTPGYMSPEQAAGVRELDARTDVYGLACVLYEMLIGETPGLWLTEEAVRLGRFIDASSEHRAQLDRLSGRLEQVLAKALAMRPDQRYPTPGEFTAALRSTSSPSQRFRDSEVRQIIGHAAEIQAANPTEDGALTRGAVEQVAAEVGIEPAHVRQAARDLAPRGKSGALARRTPWSWFLGSPHVLQIDRVADGEVRETDFPILVEEMRTTLGNVGYVSTLGRSLAWSTTNPGQGAGRNVQISVAPRDGRTRIHIEEHLGQLAGGLFGGLMGGGGGAGAATAAALATETLHSPLFAVVGVTVSIVGTYITSRSIFTHTASKRVRALEALADRLVEVVEASATRRPAVERGPDLGLLGP